MNWFAVYFGDNIPRFKTSTEINHVLNSELNEHIQPKLTHELESPKSLSKQEHRALCLQESNDYVVEAHLKYQVQALTLLCPCSDATLVAQISCGSVFLRLKMK